MPDIENNLILALGLDPKFSEMPIPGERRLEYRRVVDLAGICEISETDGAVECRIADMTSKGAQLVLKDGETLPNRFKLYISGLNIALNCQIVWRSHTRVGVSLMPI